MPPDRIRHVRDLTRDGITVLESYLPPETCDAVRATVRERAGGDSPDRDEPFELCADPLPTDDADPADVARPADGDRLGEEERLRENDRPDDDQLHDDRPADSFRSADGGVERPPTDGGATLDTDTPDTEPLTTPGAIRSIGGPLAWLTRVAADPTLTRILDSAGDRAHAPTRGTIRREATAPDEPYRYRAGDGFRVVVYLSDVSTCGAGPVAYLAGSHRASLATRAAGRLVNTLARRHSRRVLFHDTKTPIAPTGPRGTVVIVDRTGYHRFLPPATDDSRTLASITYEPCE